MQCSEVQCSAVECSARPCTTTMNCTVTCIDEPALNTVFVPQPSYWLERLQCTNVVYCIVVKYLVLQCSGVQYSTVQCSTVQYSAVQFSTVQCIAVQCSVVQCHIRRWAIYCGRGQCQRFNQDWTTQNYIWLHSSIVQ